MIVVVLFMSCVRLREMCVFSLRGNKGDGAKILERGKKGHKTHNNIYKNFKRQLHTFLGVVVHHPFENSTNILPGFSVDKGYLLLFFLFFM